MRPKIQQSRFAILWKHENVRRKVAALMIFVFFGTGVPFRDSTHFVILFRSFWGQLIFLLRFFIWRFYFLLSFKILFLLALFSFFRCIKKFLQHCSYLPTTKYIDRSPVPRTRKKNQAKKCLNGIIESQRGDRLNGQPNEHSWYHLAKKMRDNQN